MIYIFYKEKEAYVNTTGVHVGYFVEIWVATF